MNKRMSTPAALAAGALVAVVLTPGSAVAATAKSVLLGRSNKATTTTVIAKSKGTPLALTAKNGSAPLKVTRAPRSPASTPTSWTASARRPSRARPDAPASS